MSSVPWLRAYDGADLREQIYNERPGSWVGQPSFACYPMATCLSRAATMNAAVKWNQDWHFEQQDKGAFTLTIDGTRSSKNGLVIALGSDMADAFGFYLVLSPRGATVYRRVIGEYTPIDPASYWRETLAPAPGQVRAVPAPLQQSGPVTFTVVYEYGTLRIYNGSAPGQGTLLVEYVNPAPGMGNYKWGVGLYGAPNGDKLTIASAKKWVSS